MSAHGPHDHRDHPHGGSPDWDAMYTGRPRWDIGRPQPAFLALAEAGEIRGRVLDVGCGTGEHALMCASVGLDATGVDLSATAIHAAQSKAHERGLPARFLHHDVCRLGDLAESFDAVLDSGLFVHIVDNADDRTAYLDGLRSVTSAGARYFMLCFRGPSADTEAQRLTGDEIASHFADSWHLDSIEPATLESLTDSDGIPAWLVMLTRV